jgi:hypothetical protein
MSKLVAKFRGRHLLAFADFPAVDHHVPLRSGALLRGYGREGRPALFYLVTAAVRTGGLFRIMLRDVQSL